MSLKKSASKTYVTSYRIGLTEKKAIVKKYGSLSAFLNKCVEKECKKLLPKNDSKKLLPKNDSKKLLPTKTLTKTDKKLTK